MAFSAKQLSLFLLLTLLSSLHTHARESQFFTKVPSTTNTVVVPNNKEAPNNQQEQQDPNFLPENENGYGLYGHESGQDPPSTTAQPSTTTTTTATATTPYNTEFKQPVHKYLPKNYNPVAYVTQPEDINDSTAFTEERSFSTNPNNNNNYYNGEQNYYSNQQEEEETEFRSNPTTTNNRDNGNYYNNGGSSFNSQPQGLSDTRYRGGATLISRDNYFSNGGANGFQPQGMSDTRFMENGKYFYDISTEKYNENHPYESLKGVRARNEYNNRNFYGNAENNAYEFNNENSMGGYQNKEEFQYEENMP